MKTSHLQPYPSSMKQTPCSEAARSPFRYPGGKAFLADYIHRKLESVEAEQPEYAEPYAGGAGAGIRLLGSGLVKKLRINDADPRVFAAWHSIVEENERFLDRLASCKIDIATWKEQSEIVRNPGSAGSHFDLGFATFFLNRTNRSGIILGAGPIGGYEQKGDWKLDARFYRKTLIRRIEWIGRNASKFVLSNLDGLSYLRKASKRNYSKQTLFFIDPPYVGAGGRLYMNSMNDKKHTALANFLKARSIENWIVTYDDCPLISQIYEGASQSKLDVLYSLQKKRTQSELLITPA